MRFNVRIYGLLLSNNSVLLSDELIGTTWITKFPGGGLEFGEGSIECVVREFKEELDLEVIVLSHFYTTDFYVKSAFDESQIISIYYLVELKQKTHTIELPALAHQKFRWMKIEEISKDTVTLVIDKHVAQMLHTAFKS